MLSLLVVIDGIDYFASGIRVIGPAALLQLLRLNVKIRVLYSSNSCFSTFCTTGARTAFVVLAHLNRQHLFWLKVVEQVRAWDQAQGADQPFAKRQVEDVFTEFAVRRPEATPSSSSSKRETPLTSTSRTNTVVQTKQVDIQLIARAQLQHVGDEHLHADRNVAHPDKAFEIGVAIDRLGDHARRVGKVDDPCVGANFLHIFHDVENHRDGAQSFKQPARPVGLLAR